MAPYSLVQSVHDGEKIRVRYTLQAKVSVEDEAKKTTQEVSVQCVLQLQGGKRG